MSKPKTSQSKMKDFSPIVLGVGYCELQRLLSYESPIAYATSQYGWACDLYLISDKYSIVTGYSYSRACNRQLTSEQREELQAIEKYCFDSRPDRQTRKDLLIAFLEKHFN